MVEFVIARMAAEGDALALATPDARFSYSDLLARTRAWRGRLAGLGSGHAISVEGEYGLETIAAFLAVAWTGNIAVPLSPDAMAHHEPFRGIAGVEFRIIAGSGEPAVESVPRRLEHPLYESLRASGHPGLVLFSSGSTGVPKAAVHDLSRLLAKFRTVRQKYRTLVFLLLDHIGGINTLFYTLTNGGAVVVPLDRSATAVCNAIETHRVELLPASPTFLNLLLLSGQSCARDLSSLRLITYGTEPMPASTLEQATRAFPHARFLQTYGLTEVGILRSQSRDNGSLWVRVGGEDYDCKVMDGLLHIRSRSAMLGYLNAPSPFDADGYFNTGDRVEVDGEWLRILGRDTDVINVGGTKVHPSEIESVVLEMDNVGDVVVAGERHPLVGQIVVATVRLRRPEPADAFKTRMRKFCASRLTAYQIPARIRFAEDAMYSARFKRIRKHEARV